MSDVNNTQTISSYEPPSHYGFYDIRKREANLSIITFEKSFRKLIICGLGLYSPDFFSGRHLYYEPRTISGYLLPCIFEAAQYSTEVLLHH